MCTMRYWEVLQSKGDESASAQNELLARTPQVDSPADLAITPNVTQPPVYFSKDSPALVQPPLPADISKKFKVRIIKICLSASKSCAAAKGPR